MCYSVGNDGTLKGETRQCSIGQYWDQSALTCRSSREVSCERDKCTRDHTLYTYAYESDCRGFWKCQNGVSVGNCCPKGEAYKADLGGCVRDSSCNTMCDSHDIIVDCDKRASRGNPSQFQQLVRGNQFILMDCPSGLRFFNDVCRCGYASSDQTLPKAACKNELELEFVTEVKDISGNNLHVEAINVTIKNGSACFQGDGALIIPRFANAEIGDNLEINVRYSLDTDVSKQTKRQALVYNGDCDFTSPLVVAVDSEETYYGLSNHRGIYKHVAVKDLPKKKKWNDATYTLHNKVMKAVVNGHQQSTDFNGRIARSRCGLKIGWAKDLSSFYGCIDKISVSFCPAEKTYL